MNRCRVTGGMRDGAGIARSDVCCGYNMATEEMCCCPWEVQMRQCGRPLPEEGGLRDCWGPQVRISWIYSMACVFHIILEH